MQAQTSKGETSKPRTREIKCFKCHGLGHIASECVNKKAMIMEGGELVSEEEFSVEGELSMNNLVVKRGLSVENRSIEEIQ